MGLRKNFINTRLITTAVVCATLLWGGRVLATPAQQRCDKTRVLAWKVYRSCVERTVARIYLGTSFDVDAAFARCRHAYFKRWVAFRSVLSLAGSTCVSSDRFVDSGGTVTDFLTGLVWEKKTDDGSIHDKDNTYDWSTGSPYGENGTAFTSFLRTLNGGTGFAGSNGWRLPTLAELQSIVRDFPCTGAGGGSRCSCSSSPCVDPIFGFTQSDFYWSSTLFAFTPNNAWAVYFYFGTALELGTKSAPYVRAVRGGS